MRYLKSPQCFAFLLLTSVTSLTTYGNMYVPDFDGRMTSIVGENSHFLETSWNADGKILAVAGHDFGPARGSSGKENFGFLTNGRFAEKLFSDISGHLKISTGSHSRPGGHGTVIPVNAWADIIAGIWRDMPVLDQPSSPSEGTNGPIPAVDDPEISVGQIPPICTVNFPDINNDVHTSPVPEGTLYTAGLLALGALGLVFFNRRFDPLSPA